MSQFHLLMEVYDHVIFFQVLFVRQSVLHLFVLYLIHLKIVCILDLFYYLISQEGLVQIVVLFDMVGMPIKSPTS